MRPKLLLAADTYYPKVDGTLKFMEEFLKRTKNDFEISLLVPFLGERRGEKVTYLEPSGIFSVSGYPSLKLSFSNFHKIRTAIWQADIVFVQGPALISYLSIYYAHKFHKKTIFYTHTIAWELFEKFFPPLLNTLFLNLIKKLSIAAYNRCNEIFVPYYDLKKALAKAGVRTELTVARLGVDIEVFSPSKDKRLSKERLGINHGKMVIGYVGRVSKEKNTHLLLQAFRRLPHQENLHLLIVGDGPESQTREFKETANCTVTGFVGNVQDYLKAMDIFVMPSLTETTSLATLEAMASGLAVVVTKVGFIQNYVVKGYNGLFFPRNSSALLAIKMEQLIKERGLREQLGQNARKTIAYSFSWERSINKIKRLLLR
ncbi:glycosyltransferase [Candidatus Woesearchaeota archaeon]|nr:glycosyltransferase [Candidatus Woesearchaeota archaeon]